MKSVIAFLIALLVLNGIILAFVASKRGSQTPNRVANVEKLEVSLTMDELVAIALSDHELLDEIARPAFAKANETIRAKTIDHWASYSFQTIDRKLSSDQQAEFRKRLLKASDDLLSERNFEK